MHYVVIDLKPEHVGHSIRPYLYIGRDPGMAATIDTHPPIRFSTRHL